MTGLLQRAAVGFATVGPFGFAPIAPGTAGSVAGLVLFWAVRSTRSIWLEVAVLLVVTVAGVAAAAAAEARYRRRDPGLVVIDEVAGMLVTLVAVPVGFTRRPSGVLRVSPVRHRQAVPGTTGRTAAGGVGRDGR